MIVGCCALAGRTGHAAGRQLLERLYREETGQPLPGILISVRGKPYFEAAPYHFSISHTARHAFCALSRRPVGIDAEELDRAVRFSLAGRIMSPRELARFQAAADPQRAFLALWVLKEATAKCTGAGLTGFPNSTDFSPDDPRVFTWQGYLVAVVGQEDETEGMILHDF